MAAYIARPKPKNQRSKRAMAARAPKLVEDPKGPLILRGTKSSAIVSAALKDFHILAQPNSLAMHKHHEIHPFEDASSLEFLSTKNDKALFVFGNSNKKRPHNIVMGRFFDHQLLDQFEFGINPDTFQSLSSFEKSRQAMIRFNSKPCIVFQGDLFETNTDCIEMKSFFLDYFRGETLEKMNLSAFDRLIVISALTPTSLKFRHYGISMKKSSDSKPRIELDEAGPRCDLTFRRRQQASSDLVTKSMQSIKDPRKSKEKKNLEVNELGEKIGRIHMKRQDLSNVAIAKLKGLKRRREGDADDTASQTTEQSENGDTMETDSVFGDEDSITSSDIPKKRMSGPGGYGPNTSHVKPQVRTKKRRGD